MNVLWVTNVALPEASFAMNVIPSPYGGWLFQIADSLVNQGNIVLAVAFPKKGLHEVNLIEGKKIKYYAFPPISEENISNNMHLEKVLELVKPDIINIYGTEHLHTLAMVNASLKKNIRVVITIQGLASVIAKHYLVGIPSKISERSTFRDFIRQDNLIQQQHKLFIRGSYEIKAIKSVKHIIGRTSWDKACTSQINPEAHYHFCNETLREEFYKYAWDIKTCDKYTMFFSQGSSPIKGLHYMLEAMPKILMRYPTAQLYISGNNIFAKDTLIQKIKMSSYGKYINEIIRKFYLHQNIVFTGVLDEKQMVKRYLKSHVFVSSSSIENSSNSLCEAMLLGVPCIASYVGGTADLMTHGEEGFAFQSDAPYMLAHYVCELFSNDDLALKFSAKAQARARDIHAMNINRDKLIGIYEQITSLPT